MRPCFHTEIPTPKGVLLNGLWFGPKKPRRLVIWVHGLGSSAFTKLDIVDRLIDAHTAVLTFNNRGHEKISRLRTARASKSRRSGAAHEVFTDCIDDIEGAINFAKRTARHIYLAGHSSGCQKSAYWAAKRGRGVRGIVLLAPVSDYSAESMAQGTRTLEKAERVARRFVRDGRKHELLPESIWKWPWIADAQRFISLYSGKSAEEIFTYWDEKRNPAILKKIRKPILVLLAEKDEYAKGLTPRMADWFRRSIRAKHHVAVIQGAPHSFRGSEKLVAREIRKFISA